MGYRLGQSTDDELEDHGDVIAHAVSLRDVTATDTVISPQFYRPVGGFRFADPEYIHELEAAVDYEEERLENMTQGAKNVMGMWHLGGAFRFIEKLYGEDQITFQERRMAGNLICDRYEDLRRDAYIWAFSRGNPDNEGCL